MLINTPAVVIDERYPVARDPRFKLPVRQRHGGRERRVPGIWREFRRKRKAIPFFRVATARRIIDITENPRLALVTRPPIRRAARLSSPFVFPTETPRFVGTHPELVVREVSLNTRGKFPPAPLLRSRSTFKMELSPGEGNGTFHFLFHSGVRLENSPAMKKVCVFV